MLPLLAAAILFRGGCLLHNCPRLSDVAAAAEILEHLGCRVDRTGHSIWVDAQDLCRDEIPRALMERMRSSILFLGPLLARTGRCTLYEPGGCCLGARPIDLHLAGLEALGAEFSWDRDLAGVPGEASGWGGDPPVPQCGGYGKPDFGCPGSGRNHHDLSRGSGAGDWRPDWFPDSRGRSDLWSGDLHAPD